MNFKAKILKLSILIMLVLVLIPAISAQDSSEAFFAEHAEFAGFADEAVEVVVVEESDSIDVIEDAQDDVSLSYELGEAIHEEEYVEHIPIQDQSSEIDEAIIIEEQIEFSVVETHDVIDEVNEEDEIGVYCENVIGNLVYINHIDDEDIDHDVTIENVSIKHGSIIVISEEFKHDIILINELSTETENYETFSFKRSSIKVSELKNNLLINQDVSFVFADNFMADIDGDIIICTDKLTTDFVFSIDNSVVGDDNLIVFVTTSFCLNFSPCFDAFVCCNFLGFESYFGGRNEICHSIYYYNPFVIDSCFNIDMMYAGLLKACLENFKQLEVKT